MKKILTFLIAIAGLLCVGTASAAPWTFSISGTIGDGFDTGGVFGSANTDLSGKAYSMSYTLDPSLYATQVGGTGSGDTVHYGYGALTGSGSQTVTVAGVSQTYVWDLSKFNYGQASLANWMPRFPDWEAYQNQKATTADGLSIFSSATVYDDNVSSLIGLIYDQVWSYTPTASDSSYAFFELSDADGLIADFSADSTNQGSSAVTSISINAANNVPEPESLALVGLGLIAMFSRRRS